MIVLSGRPVRGATLDLYGMGRDARVRLTDNGGLACHDDRLHAVILT